MKYPIGIETFDKLINGGYVYVDKTDLVYKLADEGSVYFLRRPRRFGKSLLISTLENYFLGRKELFKGLKIDSLEKDWIEYPVFSLSFAKGEYAMGGTLESTLNMFISAAENKYGRNPVATTLADRFFYVLECAHEKTGRQAVVLIDEYDKPLLDTMDQELYTTDRDGNRMRIEEYNRNILKGFYGVFKAADRHLKFVMLTGVTKFSQISVFSGFNQPEDISMTSDYEALCGITKEELLTVFDESIRELAKKLKLSYDDTVAKLKQNYDGYHFGEEMTDIYNPFSLLNCLKFKSIKDYWFRSATPTYLMRLLQHFDENINELTSKYYPASEFVDYKADMERPLPMIYQSGYLTIKGYNPRRQTYLLDFPNKEVRDGFVNALASGYFMDANSRQLAWLDNVSDALEAGDTPLFMRQITALLSDITYRFQRKDDGMECERYFQYTFYLILQMIGVYNTYVEKETSQGRIDCVVECPEHVYVFEFKLNGSAKAALEQINERGYATPYAADTRALHKVGVNFSSEKGTIDKWCME